jgi:hypothetical protein
MSMMIVLRIIGVASAVPQSDAESCSWVKMGQRLLGFARAKSLYGCRVSKVLRGFSDVI